MKNDLRKQFNIGSINFEVYKAFGISKGGYFHLPLLVFASGKNGFLIQIMGLGLTVGWMKNTEL